MDDFDALYRQHLPAVFRYALRCVGRRDIAEEIVADAFVALYSNRDRIEVAQLPGWLLTVVRNRAVDHWRHQSLEQRTLAESPAAAGNDPEHGESLNDWLVGQCKELKPSHRACLLLRFVHGMTREEIARELGMTENQVKGALQYALELLRKSFLELRRESR